MCPPTRTHAQYRFCSKLALNTPKLKTKYREGPSGTDQVSPVDHACALLIFMKTHTMSLESECIRRGHFYSIVHFILVLNRVNLTKMTSSITKAQRQNFLQFTMQDLMNPSEFRAKAQAALFQPYCEERLLYGGSPLPDLEVQFSWMDTRKPPQDGKEWYQAVLQFSPKGTPTRETRMALGN